MAWYKTVILCLQKMFLAHKEECGGTVDQTSSDWADLRVRKEKTLPLLLLCFNACTSVGLG